jgi:hypothetical protein
MLFASMCPGTDSAGVCPNEVPSSLLSRSLTRTALAGSCGAPPIDRPGGGLAGEAEGGPPVLVSFEVSTPECCCSWSFRQH